MSKLTVTLPDDLHQQIRLELERQGITTAQFIELAVHNFFEQQKEGVHMATRTMAFQVSEESSAPDDEPNDEADLVECTENSEASESAESTKASEEAPLTEDTAPCADTDA